MSLEKGKVSVDRVEVATTEKPFEFRPGEGVVLADDEEGLAVLGLEVATSGGNPHPG